MQGNAGFDPWGQGRSSGEEMATRLQSSYLEILWTQEPCGLQSMALQRVGQPSSVMALNVRFQPMDFRGTQTLRPEQLLISVSKPVPFEIKASHLHTE